MTLTVASRDLSVIIPASGEEATIGSILTEVEKLQPREIIVIVNGSHDGTAEIVRNRGHRLVEFSERLGHDVGRSVGASIASGRILLFLDADIVIRVADLEPFVGAIESGYDVALNDIDLIVSRYPWDPVSIQKIWLNVCLNRHGLQTASLTAVPHALSRNVFRYIKPEDLTVPPKAYAKLLMAPVRISKAHSVDVVTTNKIHPWHGIHEGRDVMAELIVGDHLEALEWFKRSVVSGVTRGRDEVFRHDASEPGKTQADPVDVGSNGSIGRVAAMLWHWLTHIPG